MTVNTEWTGPDRFMTTNTAQHVMGNTYSSSVMISSFGRDQSGDYDCTVMITSPSPFIPDSNIQKQSISLGNLKLYDIFTNSWYTYRSTKLQM